MVGFFFQSLYLAPISNEMNKNLYTSSLLGNFFPFSMEDGGGTADLMHTLVSIALSTSESMPGTTQPSTNAWDFMK